ncbi:MAG: hypothetical protein KF716_32265 [Anaerolineae bacterium]|nr:hypothetical protein [Anaerolineae bacterium]
MGNDRHIGGRMPIVVGAIPLIANQHIDGIAVVQTRSRIHPVIGVLHRPRTMITIPDEALEHHAQYLIFRHVDRRIAEQYRRADALLWIGIIQPRVKRTVGVFSLFLIAHDDAVRNTADAVFVAYLPVNIVGREIGEVFPRVTERDDMIKHFHGVILVMEHRHQHLAVCHQIGVIVQILAGDIGDVISILLRPHDHVVVAAVEVTRPIILFIRTVVGNFVRAPMIGVVIVQAFAAPIVVGLPCACRHQIHDVGGLAVIPHHERDIRHVAAAHVLQPHHINAACPISRDVDGIRNRPRRLDQSSNWIGGWDAAIKSGQGRVWDHLGTAIAAVIAHAVDRQLVLCGC